MGRIDRRGEPRALVNVQLDAELQPLVGMADRDLPSLVHLLGRLALGLEDATDAPASSVRGSSP